MEVDQDTEMQPSSSHTSGKCEKKSNVGGTLPWYYKSRRNITFETKIFFKRKIVKMPKDMSILDQRKSNPNGDEDENHNNTPRRTMPCLNKDPEQSSDTSEMGEEEMNSEEALEVLSESLGLTQHRTDRSRITMLESPIEISSGEEATAKIQDISAMNQSTTSSVIENEANLLLNGEMDPSDSMTHFLDGGNSPDNENISENNSPILAITKVTRKRSITEIGGPNPLGKSTTPMRNCGNVYFETDF